MKTPIFLFLLFSAYTQCTTLRMGSMGLSAKWDESFEKPIYLIYIKVDAGLVSEESEKIYDAVIRGFKTELKAQGVEVLEDFTGTTTGAPAEQARPDAHLVLGRLFQDEWANSPDRKAGLPHNVERQRIAVQLYDPDTNQAVWIGEVLFKRKHAGLVGKKIVSHWKTIGY